MIRTLSTTLCAALLLSSASLHADELNIYSLAQQPQQRHLEHYLMVRHGHDKHRDRDFRDEHRSEHWERWRDDDKRRWGHSNHWNRGYYHWGRSNHWNRGYHWGHRNYWRNRPYWNHRRYDDYWRPDWRRYNRY